MELTHSIINKGNSKLENRLNGLKTEEVYVNLSKHHIVVCFRDGCYGVLAPDPEGPYNNSIIVGKVKSNNKGVIKTIVDHTSDDLDVINDGLRKSSNRYTQWEEIIDLDVLEESRTGLYVVNLDIYIVIVDHADRHTFHPYCQYFKTDRDLMEEDDFDPKAEVSFKLKIVDNKNPGVDYYTIINDDITVLKTLKSPLQKNGFYIIGSPELMNGGENKIRKIEILSVETALDCKSKFPLFRSINEANAYKLDKETKHLSSKLELAEHEKIVQKIKMEVEVLQQENNLLQSKRVAEENKLKDFKAEYERLQQANKEEYELRLQRLKEESARRSDEMNLRTVERKGDMEWIKLATGVVGFVFLIAKLI